MSVVDPTSLPTSSSFATRADVTYTVDEVALLQTLSVIEAAPKTGDSRLGATAEESPMLQLRNVSGRYRGRAGELELELRVDVDGRRPMRRVSGDFYRTTGGTTTYVGSFLLTMPTLIVNQAEVVIDGQGVYTFTTGSPRLRVTIPRVGNLMPPAAAVAQFLTSAGVPGALYSCMFESTFFRRIELESDFVSGVPLFQSYNTALLPSGGAARVLTVPAAYGESGIEMVDTGETNDVPIHDAGVDRIWTNRELHASMERHFHRFSNEPGWRVWLLAATIHEEGQGLRGIMFDLEGAQRQGCAVFHDVIGGTSSPVTRAQLRTYVHELGHCFNLCHSHQKEFMHPPQPNRMDALSWMHYPDYYQSTNGTGAGAYWAAFPFQFDDLELVHLRHAFRNDIIMGGNTFGVGAADVSLLFADPIEDRSGLALQIQSAASFYFGEPVVLGLKLATTDTRGKRVNARIHPKHGYLQIGISQPGRKVTVYRPMIQQCTEPELITLDAATPAVYDSAYIGYGKDGLYFGEPGMYELRAVYHALDGSRVFSNVLRFRVDAPADQQEREIASLFLGDEQGRLLYLLGSDADSLQAGNEAFDLMLYRHGDHPMAVYANLVKGMNASRSFKTVDTLEKRITVRAADYRESADRLAQVVETTVAANPTADATADVGVDNITLTMAMECLVMVQREAGDLDTAQKTAHNMASHFAQQGIPSFIQSSIERQATQALHPGKGGEEPAQRDRPKPGSRRRKKE